MKHNEIKYDYRGKQILVIPDMHMPYHHKDALVFLICTCLIIIKMR